MPSRIAQMTIAGMVLALSGAWLWESFTCGRCFISIYVAPVIIVGNLAGAVWSFRRSGEAVVPKYFDRSGKILLDRFRRARRHRDGRTPARPARGCIRSPVVITGIADGNPIIHGAIVNGEPS